MLTRTSDNQLDRLAEVLRRSVNPTADLVTQIVSEACPRTRILDRTAGATARIEALAKASAWTDLAFALIAYELPAWSVRRLAREDGAWFCALSNHPGLPIELDDTAEASHECLPLAILSALLEARRKIAMSHEPQTRTVPQIERQPGDALCCDNFA